MKLLLVLAYCTLVLGNPNVSRGFTLLVESLKGDDSIDMDELLTHEDDYLNEQSHKDEIIYSELELLGGDEEIAEDEQSSEVDDEDEGDDDVDDRGEPRYPDISGYPNELDWRAHGVMHRAIHQGFYCGSCGWVAGTQTLEARVAIVSENYIPYSIQMFMNCVGRPCVGAQPFSVQTQAMKQNFIVPEYEIPYTQRACVKAGPGKSECYKKCGKNYPYNYTNALHDQFVVIVGSRGAHTKNKLIKALQGGPLHTCYSKRNKPPGEKCRAGCSHANSIIGYTNESFIIQNSYGKNYGPFNNGSWITPMNSSCANGLIKKAAFPNVLYDYDRANAYYTQVEGGVKEEELSFIDMTDYGVTVNDTKNWGTTKNKCAFLGSACKGVVELSPGTFKLVSHFGLGSAGPRKAFRKFQMVIYLKHEDTGRYIGIENHTGLVPVEKERAAPFFTSYGRFVSFEYPKLHVVNNTLEPVKSSVREIALNFNRNPANEPWQLSHCIMHNVASGKSMSQEMRKKMLFLTTAPMDRNSTFQRFSVGISGKWKLESELSGDPWSSSKKGFRYFAPLDKTKFRPIKFIWQQRQIMDMKGLVLGSDLSRPVIDYSNSTNQWTPTDCRISKLDNTGVQQHLLLENGKIVMAKDANSTSGWTFEYADL